MKLSRGGIIVAGIYTGIFFLLQLETLLSGDKGAAVFSQLSVFPAEVLLIVLPLSLGPMKSWLDSIAIFFL